jgi:hypothetical protein
MLDFVDNTVEMFLKQILDINVRRCEVRKSSSKFGGDSNPKTRCLKFILILTLPAEPRRFQVTNSLFPETAVSTPFGSQKGPGKQRTAVNKFNHDGSTTVTAWHGILLKIKTW